MIAIHEMWPFSKKPNEEQASQASQASRKVLGQGLRSNEGGGVGKVLGNIAKRNKLLAQVAGQD